MTFDFLTFDLDFYATFCGAECGFQWWCVTRFLKPWQFPANTVKIENENTKGKEMSKNYVTPGEATRI
ncbi:MAG: hypothetical protein F6K54_18850, partial [Okeania sp. SIO3B5]|uniref:hypothetical protein n=1 Tax=Okeania sp. SIO3B5 TaxID=2607811 RepID=UPI0013FF6CD4